MVVRIALSLATLKQLDSTVNLVDEVKLLTRKFLNEFIMEREKNGTQVAALWDFYFFGKITKSTEPPEYSSFQKDKRYNLNK